MLEIQCTVWRDPFKRQKNPATYQKYSSTNQGKFLDLYAVNETGASFKVAAINLESFSFFHED